MTKRNTLTKALLVGCAAFCSCAPVVFAQDPIRVESNQVLVPAVVFDKQLYTRLENKSALDDSNAPDPQLRESVVVRNLVAKDFHLFEDGMEQRIQSVTLERPAGSIVRDNMGNHPELIGTGGGRWSDPDQVKTDLSIWRPLPQYVIAYIPAPSLEGSCHQIKVKMARHNLAVWARNEYCNTPHSAFDPLKGTEFGKLMEDNLASAEGGKIDLTLQAIPFYRDAGATRVYVRLEFPAKSLKHEIKEGTLYASIGALLMVYNRDGSLAARFSDFACCDNSSRAPSSKSKAPAGRASPDLSMIPNRYETQFDLPPGEYEIRAILSDGEKFGRQRLPLTVENVEGKQLAISEIALARRIRAVTPESSANPGRISGGFAPLVSKNIEFTPTRSVRCKKGQMFYAYFEIYEPQIAGMPPATVEAHLRIFNTKTGAVNSDFQTVNAAPYAKAGSPVIPIGRRIDLKSLPGGSYRLDVWASDSTGKKTAWRTANFTIE
jgi:hypothetical protein